MSKPIFSSWQQLVNDYNNNRLAHAYLFSGPEGAGKKTMAKDFIKHILHANELLCKRIDEDNFLDLLCINKSEKSEITIDMVREANDFFNQTPAESHYKFVIIDAVDDLNNNAANALLKILEEPTANTIIFLINHISGKILKTIRSRSRMIRFMPKMANDLKSSNEYEVVLKLIKDEDILEFNKYAERATKNWRLTVELIMFLINRAVKFSANILQPSESEVVLSILAKNKTIEEWFKIYDQVISLIKDTEIYNLDKKQTLFIVLNLMGGFKNKL